MRRALQLVLLLIALAIAWQAVRGLFPDRERQIRTGLREVVTNHYPEATRRVVASMGIRRHPMSPAEADRDVLLIHGLDDPGRVWMNLAPALAAAGHRTWILTYPNDQPIAVSARFAAEQLAALQRRGVERLSIVAHSMGGLVSRELLTHPELACDSGAVCPRPVVAQLIMIGTPNHGSELARLRGFAEVREQITKLFDDDFHWLRFIIDGAGEAGLDLMPGSAFLDQLNRRPSPSDTEYLVIAGVLAPSDRRRMLDRVRTAAGDAELLGEVFERLLPQLEALLTDVGDGLVSLPSARLAGVPVCVVTGTHLSIVRNVFAASERLPPAVPLVLQAVARGVPAAVRESCPDGNRTGYRTNT